MRLATFWRTRRSVVSVEIGFIALPFLMLLLGMMEVSYDMYVQSAMNLAAAQSMRLIWTGQVQGPISSTSFVTNNLCPIMSGLIDCNLVTVRAQKIAGFPTTDFWTFMTSNHLPNYQTGSGSTGSLNTAGWAVCTGGPGAAVLFEIVYAGPTFVGGLLPVWSVNNAGTRVHPTYAAAGFVNQAGFTVTATC